MFETHVCFSCVFLLQEVGTEFVHRVTVESRIPLVVSSGPNYSRSHQPSLSTSINRWIRKCYEN